jgi:hypothetical protein
MAGHVCQTLWWNLQWKRVTGSGYVPPNRTWVQYLFRAFFLSALWQLAKPCIDILWQKRDRAHTCSVVITAAANKLARVAWEVLSSGEEYRPPTDALLNRRGKDAFGLEAQNRAPTLPHYGDDYLEFPPRFIRTDPKSTVLPRLEREKLYDRLVTQLRRDAALWSPVPQSCRAE